MGRDKSGPSLWGDLGTPESVRTPAGILREQAAELSRITGNTLEGRVETFPYEGKFITTLKIRAPFVGNYSYELLEVRHSAQIYPAIVTDNANEKSHKCTDEAAFKAVLQQILQSDAVRRVLALLRSPSA